MAGVRAKAPGKIILSGEHAVVNGATAVAAAVDIYTHATFYPIDASASSNSSSQIDNGSMSIHLKDLGLSFFWKLKRLEEAYPNLRKIPSSPQSCSPDFTGTISRLIEEQNVPGDKTFLVSGLSAFLYLYMSILGFRPGKVIVSSDLPMGAGLGSSASFCVSLSAVLLASSSDAVILETKNHQNGCWSKPDDVDLQLINKWAFEGEKIIHGKPSGVDNTVITYGNTIAFKLGELTHIKCGSPINMLITNTRVARNTKRLVASVSGRAKRHPDAMSAVFNSLDMISKELSTIIGSPILDDLSLTDKDEKLEELMEMSQGLLQCMGVSHPCIETVVRTTLKYNLVSKLTGAGGGGCVLTLLPKLVSKNIKDRYYGVNDPVALKLLNKAGEMSSLAPPDDESIKTLYVGGLDTRVTDQDLRDQFYAHGEIEAIKLVPQRACAFVTYTTREGAERAAEELSNKLVVKGLRLKLLWGKPQVPKQENQSEGSIQGGHVAALSGMLPRAVVSQQQGDAGEQSDPSSDQQQPLNYFNIPAPPPSDRAFYPSMDPRRMGAVVPNQEAGSSSKSDTESQLQAGQSAYIPPPLPQHGQYPQLYPAYGYNRPPAPSLYQQQLLPYQPQQGQQYYYRPGPPPSSQN